MNFFTLSWDDEFGRKKGEKKGSLKKNKKNFKKLKKFFLKSEAFVITRLQGVNDILNTSLMMVTFILFLKVVLSKYSTLI